MGHPMPFHLPLDNYSAMIHFMAEKGLPMIPLDRPINAMVQILFVLFSSANKVSVCCIRIAFSCFASGLQRGDRKSNEEDPVFHEVHRLSFHFQDTPAVPVSIHPFAFCTFLSRPDLRSLSSPDW